MGAAFQSQPRAQLERSLRAHIALNPTQKLIIIRIFRLRGSGTLMALRNGMPSKPLLIPKSCQFNCIVLSSYRDERGADPVLPHEHLACAWLRIHSYVRRLAAKSLKAYPSSAIGCRIENGPNNWIFYRVRTNLASNASLLDDLVQDVACEFIEATCRGKVNAAVPALFGWAKVATYRIVVRAAKPAILLALGGYGSGASSDEDHRLAADTANVCGSTEIDGSTPSPLDRGVLLSFVESRPDILTNLTPARRDVLVQWLRGNSPGEIARNLGISRVAASLRLMHAKRALAA